ncbi:OmpA family protein [Paralysiella testudinis]|uniref:OmpA family protein n=1 Tax=Paralysiella testudinis TaxID=2809020 RepID=A0A892ZII0_9NEIS|nr:OmpA family protein [Paralysiella testudinis]QRQ83011.1 OmpA family protein [Paralysiella testudinis]
MKISIFKIIACSFVPFIALPAFADLTIIERTAGQVGSRDTLQVVEKPIVQNYTSSEIEQLQLENLVLRNEITRLQQIQAATYRVQPYAQPNAVVKQNTITFGVRGNAVLISEVQLLNLVSQIRNAKGVTIRGYTDSTGTSAVNRRVAALRAESLKKKLVAKGIPASKIKTQSILGNYIASNATAAGRAKNRRVIIIFHNN